MQSRQNIQNLKKPAMIFYFLSITITAAVDETKTQSQNQAEYATLSVNNTEVKLKLDTGAEVNVIPIKTYKFLASTTRIQLRNPTVNLVAYNGKAVPVNPVPETCSASI